MQPGAVLSQARALQQTARRTRERTLAMRQENQALLARARQHMFLSHESAAAGEHPDVAVDAVDRLP